MGETLLTRRRKIRGLAAAAAVADASCGRSETDPVEQRQSSQPPSPPPGFQAVAMTVYRDPSCGCCEAWAEIARNAGYHVTVVDHPDMTEIKRRYGIPDEQLSCHTTVVGGYAVEGHVLLSDVQRLLSETPRAVMSICRPVHAE